MIGNFLRRFIRDQPQQPEKVYVATNRYYKVTLKDGGIRIIDVSARLHVAYGLIESVEAASARDVGDAIKAGIVIEEPGKVEPQGTLLP